MESPNPKLLLCGLCEKSFGCRKELREHMWTHVPNQGAVPTTAGEEYNSAVATEATCTVPANPDRHRTDRFFENCGKEFVSLKLCLEHGCRSSAEATAGAADDDSPSPSPPSSSQSCYQNKRARRDGNPNSSTPVYLLTEEDLAHYLVMLSHERATFTANREDSSPSATTEVEGGIRPVRRAPPLQPPVPRGMFACKTCNKVFNSHQALGGHRASHKKVKGCFAAQDEIASPETNNARFEIVSNNSEDARTAPMPAENSASTIVPSAEDSPETSRQRNSNGASTIVPSAEDSLETSRQRNSNGASTIVPSAEDSPETSRQRNSNSASTIVPSAEDSPETSRQRNSDKVHECSICGQQFSSGQALGGHKRCHWQIPNSADAAPITAAAVAEQRSSVEVGSGSDEVNEMRPHSPTIWPMFIRSDMAARMNEVAGIAPMVGGSAEVCLRLGWDIKGKRKATTEGWDDEAESREAKAARLIDLIDMEEGEESSKWLQVGIGSMAGQQSPAERA